MDKFYLNIVILIKFFAIFNLITLKKDIIYMINLIKEYIESGNSFEDLKTEYSINVNEFDNLICLNYDQIESPKSPNIVRQCRGIVLDKDTLEIVHYPFFRFFNLDEMPEERQKFNWNNAFGLQKSMAVYLVFLTSKVSGILLHVHRLAG